MVGFIRVRVLIGCVTLAILTQGCTGISRDNGEALGHAGEAAAQALMDQDGAAAFRLHSLPQWFPTREILQCAARPAIQQDQCISDAQHPPKAISDNWAIVQKKAALLETVMTKRAEAAQSLQKAYAAFADLATYDASAEAKTAVEAAAGSIDGLTATLGALFPGSIATKPIAEPVATILGDATGLIASERQSAALLQASKALHLACTAFSADLAAERDYAAAPLTRILQIEANNTYKSFFVAGLVSPSQVLSPMLQAVSPGSSIIATPPESDEKVITAAALTYLGLTSTERTQQVQVSYDKAVAALGALAEQHQKLEANAALDTASILTLVQSLETDLPKLDDNTKSP